MEEQPNRIRLWVLKKTEEEEQRRIRADGQETWGTQHVTAISQSYQSLWLKGALTNT